MNNYNYTVNYKLDNGHFRYIRDSKLCTSKVLPESFDADKKFVGGIYCSNAGQIHPHKLVKEITKMNIRKGSLYTV